MSQYLNIIHDILNSDKFKKRYWEWFDSLDLEWKEKFWYYKTEVSELYFFNAIYINEVIKNDSLD